MPGVTTVTAVRTGPTGVQTAPASTYFVAGQAERGDTAAAIAVRSIADYEAKLGARVSYGAIYDDLRTFFEEGGRLAYVARVVGAAAASGTLTLSDRAGTPQPTLRIDAKNPGAWSANVSIQVSAGTLANTFKITVTYTGTGGPGVEIFDNLPDPATAAALLANSAYVTCTNLGSATVAPNNQPAVSGPTALSAGSDDRGSVVASSYTAALTRFTLGLGAGAVSIPGQAHSAVGAGLISHAVANRRLALTAPPQGSSLSVAQAAATSLRSQPGAEYAGLFWPWITISDDAGGSRTISPEGYVAGCRARAHETFGPWRAPAGQIAVARYVTGLEQDVARASGDAADAAAVSAIRIIAGTVRLYGWRSLSTDEVNFSLLNGRDVLNYLSVQAETVLEPFVFATIDGRGVLLALINGALTGLVEPMRSLGGLYEKFAADGTRIDPGYRVDTGPSVNTPTVLSANTVKAVLSVRISPVGSLIQITVTKAALTADV